MELNNINMSDTDKRPQRTKKAAHRSVNDISASLNSKNVEEYIYNISTDPQHPAYCDIDALREHLSTSTVVLNEIRGDIGETILFNAALISDEDKALEMMQFMVEEQGNV